MGRKTFKVAVNPDVMSWARETAGVTPKEVADKLKIALATVEAWESGRGQPTLRDLEKLSDFYKRPLAAFLLPEPPDEAPLPTDFRVLPGEPRISPKLRLAIREARRLQTIATNLMKEMGLEIKANIGKADLGDNPEELAIRERARLGIDLQEQFRWKDEDEAFLRWRRAIENLNILVFQFPIPVKSARGFSLLGEGLPAIVVSSSDAIQARIFTLFHEYAHLMLEKAGICIPHEEKPDADVKEIEIFCNRFASALLVPREDFQEDAEIKAVARQPAPSDEDISKIARRFKVSRQVIWFKLLTTSLVSRDKYQEKLRIWEEEARNPPKRSYGRQLPPAKRCVQRRGPRFTSLVLEARERDVITYSDVSDYLGIRLKYLEEVQSHLGKVTGG